MINSEQLEELQNLDPADVDIPCLDCVHSFADHNDLAGCAVGNCPCSESKATLIDQEN